MYTHLILSLGQPVQTALLRELAIIWLVEGLYSSLPCPAGTLVPRLGGQMLAGAMHCIVGVHLQFLQ